MRRLLVIMLTSLTTPGGAIFAMRAIRAAGNEAHVGWNRLVVVRDVPTNQDACRGAVLALDYSGPAAP